MDYATGVDRTVVLKSPAALNTPGVVVDAGRHRVIVSGNNIVLSGLDFGEDGGWGVEVTGRSDTITNSSFHVGKHNIVPIAGNPTAADLQILRCTIDGGGQGVAGDPGHIWSLIAYNGTNLTVGWSRLLDAPQHFIEFRNGRLVVHQNLFERAGFYDGAHVNTVQFAGGNAAQSLFEFNTIYNPQPVRGFPRPGEGVQIEAQLNGIVRDTTIAFNTLIATGPALTASYLVAIRQDAGRNLIDGVTVKLNYFDATGAYGPIYPLAGGRNILFSGNVDMVTARPIVPPRRPDQEKTER